MVLSIEIPPFPHAKQQVVLAKHWQKCLETWVLALQYCEVTLADNEDEHRSASLKGISGFLGSFLVNVNPADVQDTSSDLSILAEECFTIIERIIHLGEMRESISGIERRLGSELLKDTPNAAAFDRHLLWRFIVLFWRRFPERMELIIMALPKHEFINYIRDTIVTLLAASDSYTPELYTNQEEAFTFCLLANNGSLANEVVNSSWLRTTIPSLYNALCSSVSESSRDSLVRLAYISITCLAECLTKQEQDRSLSVKLQELADDISFLIDQSTDSRNAHMSDFMNRLLWLTPLLPNLEIYNHDKLQGIAISLQLCRSRLPAFSKPKVSSKASKLSVTGTGTDENDADLNRGIYIDQLIDLFPHLSEQTASDLLSKFGDSVERVTAFVLDNPNVVSEREDEQVVKIEKNNSDLTPRDESPEFDLNKGRLHRGKLKQNSKERPEERFGSLDKQKVLDALALLYDPEDDERDDTYDDLDVGNMPVVLDDEEEDEKTNSIGTRRRGTVDPVELALWSIYQKDPQVLSRNHRSSKGREALKRHLKESLNADRTDEQIEGWARMLDRDPRRKHLLENETLLSGNPNRQPGDDKVASQEVSDSQISSSSSRSNRGKTFQKNRQQAPEKDNQAKKQQRRKEQNKSRQANHNRKAQRDKKMSKGGI